MKKLFLLSMMLLIAATSWAQSPQRMSYQAVIRDTNNALVTNHAVGMRISILQGSASGTAVFVETHTNATNANGLVSIEIGDGTLVSGNFSTINWANGPYFIKTQTDPTGGTTYSIVGSSELLSVPYALYSANGTPGVTGPTGPMGPIGPTGASGSNGSIGPIGPAGPSGADGTNGSIGPIGPTGPSGADGSNGSVGPIGPTGPSGADGINGVTGPTGPVAGSDMQIIYNNAGAAAGSANLTWNGAISTLTVSGTTNTSTAQITGLGGAGTRYVTADNSGLLSAVTFSGIAGSGTTNYIPKFTAATTIGNSTMQDNGTSISAGLATPSVIYQLYVYRQQLTANGDGQHTILGYRTRDSQNDGISYSQLSANTASTGYNFWGDVYTFGIGGWNYNDYSRCGGVLGADVNGAYWGSLGYRSSGLLNYGVYGSAGYTSGGGLLPNTSAFGVGGGFHGTLIGSTSKGEVIGQLTSGELFAQYNSGNVYTYGKNVELVKSSEKITPVYNLTSLESTIYTKGTTQLSNGSVYVPFTSDFKAIMGEVPVVTVTLNGECQGVYVSSVDMNGFTVKELNHGNSNAPISWIAAANRIDNGTMEAATKIVSAPDFDRNIQKVLYSDGHLEGKSLGIWWDGTNLRFGEITPAMNPPAKKEGVR